MKNIKYFYFLFFIFLSSCATTAGYEELLGSWVGKTEEQLIMKWGTPQSVYESNGLKYLTYIQSSSRYIPGTPATYQTQFIGNVAYTKSTGGSPGYSVTYRCQTTFFVRNGEIINWIWQGNNCKAYPKRSILDDLFDLLNKDENDNEFNDEIKATATPPVLVAPEHSGIWFGKKEKEERKRQAEAEELEKRVMELTK